MASDGATITLTFTHLPGKAKEFDELLLALLPETRNFRGCRWVHAYRHRTDENRVLLIESWDSAEAYDEYFAWRRSSGTLAPILPLLAGPPQPDAWPVKLA